MARYIKVYCKYDSDIESLKTKLKKLEEELEIVSTEGWDTLDFDSIKRRE